MDGLHVPSIVIAHTVVKSPTRHQRSVLAAVAARADQVIVMSDAANERLRSGFDVDRFADNIPYALRPTS
jgi:polysaccharide biosynthesis protein PslF